MNIGKPDEVESVVFSLTQRYDVFLLVSSFFPFPLYSRFVLKGAAYNPMDVMNCLMIRRGYKMQGLPQQRTLPNIHNKDDK